MGQVTFGNNRLLGGTTMRRLAELRRQAVVGLSEVHEEAPLDTDFPRTVDVVRRERTSAGNPTAGIDGTWAVIAGLTDLVAHVRTGARWRDQHTGFRVRLNEAQRLVLILDVPAGGTALADRVLLTDRLRFDDPVRGESVWQVKEVTPSTRDGVVVCLVEYAREDAA